MQEECLTTSPNILGWVLFFFFSFQVCVYLNSYFLILLFSISRLLVLPKENKALQLINAQFSHLVNKTVSDLFFCSCAAVPAVFIPAGSAGNPI